MLFELINTLLNKLGIIVLLAFVLSRLSMFKNYILKEKFSLTNKIVFSLIFGICGIIATYIGTPINGGIANSRSIIIIVAGLFGGPAVGISSGLIAGIHRMVIPLGELTAVSCGLSTILGGIISGYAKSKIDDVNNKWLLSGLFAFFIESIQMLIILLIAKPFDQALKLIQIIFIPMTFINSLGTGVFMLLFQQIYDEHERAGAVKAQMALNIASKTLPFLRKGLDYKSAFEAAKIIYHQTGVDAVAFTDCNVILAHIGLGSDHHIKGRNIYTKVTKKVIQTSQYIIAQTKDEIECPIPSCRLKSAIIVPLKMKEVTIGTLKLYKKHENAISKSDIELAKGLGELFSTQLELSQIDYQKSMLQMAEIKVLQAQIHPHFLFNALNTIIYFCRTDPQKARELLVKLSFYLRFSFKINDEMVSFKQELKHIESYLSIEQARFSDRLSVVYIIDDAIDCLIPPLILQPIVENAIKHGLNYKKENGKLIIKAEQKQNLVSISIIDNGIGMSNQQIEGLLTQKEKQGIGIINVQERLKNIYGTSLIIESEEGKGTCITINIPNKDVE